MHNVTELPGCGTCFPMRAIHTDFKTVFIDSSCQIIVLRRCIAESGDFGIAPQIYSECFEPFRTPYCLYIFIKSLPHSLIRTGKTPLAYRHISQLNFSAIVCQRTGIKKSCTQNVSFVTRRAYRQTNFLRLALCKTHQTLVAHSSTFGKCPPIPIPIAF